MDAAAPLWWHLAERAQGAEAELAAVEEQRRRQEEEAARRSQQWEAEAEETQGRLREAEAARQRWQSGSSFSSFFTCVGGLGLIVGMCSAARRRGWRKLPSCRRSVFCVHFLNG